MTPRQSADTLHEIHDEVRKCTDCRLHENRNHAVPGEGDPNAAVMLIGEAPGAREDATGRPFMGRSGEYLDERLADLGMGRQDVFITSVVKCRPPENRDPRADECNTCQRLWLDRQIELVDPSVVVLIGRIAVRQLLGQTEKLGDMHGRVQEKNGVRYFITYHPAAAMRFPEPDENMRADFQKLRDIVDEITK
ncbi:MAG: uracil-DNA glycosylase family protein [Armatimonadota bacterium]